MQRFSLGSIDLNLLKVIYALVVKGNMTAAGEYIGLSQPAMSHALKRVPWTKHLARPSTAG